MPVVLIVFFVLALLFRIGTLVISIRHERRLKNNGAIEYGATNSIALAFSHLLFYFVAALEGWMRRSSPDLLTLPTMLFACHRSASNTSTCSAATPHPVRPSPEASLDRCAGSV